MSRYPRRAERAGERSDNRETGPEISRGGRGASPANSAQSPARDRAEPLSRQIAIPRSEQRTPVLFRDQSYSLRASDVRTLATVGAFRVVPADALPTANARDPWHGDLDHLRRAKLVAVHNHVIEGQRVALVTLSHRGRALLQHHQSTPDDERRQEYYAGFVKPRELAHDGQLYDVYKEHASRIDDAGGRVQRVVLDYELKRQYQQFLQANNRRRHPERSSDQQQKPSNGRPDRTPEEIQKWAERHNLVVVAGHVKFPDVRIEYVDADGRHATRDVELATGHYTDRQIAAKAAAGFHMHHSGGRLGGARATHGATPRSSRRTGGIL